MVEQYPHKLYFSPGLAATQDPLTGQFVTSGTPPPSIGYSCREESKTSKVILPDGENYITSSLIYGPLETPDILQGGKVSVFSSEGTLRITGVVKSFSRGQYNVRIWV